MLHKITMELSQVRVFGADWGDPPQWPGLDSSSWPNGWECWWEGEETSVITDIANSKLYTDIPIPRAILPKRITHWPFLEPGLLHDFFVGIEGVLEPDCMFDSRMLVRLFVHRLGIDTASLMLCGAVFPRVCFTKELEGTGLTVADCDPYSKMTIVVLEKAAELAGS